ncbi:type II toxin-antitoxin system RelE/ParE family toxin [Kiritimatiellota bacterium B12222]|nr:type II toxin-antitoxin system RelE/ParE family toxin [Kiritimatiellota bacterium B12222]
MELLDEAEFDLHAGESFYNEREVGLGDYFVDCLLSDLSSLQHYAGIHSKRYGCFRLISKRFPFAIYYELEEERAVVIAILDMRRKPNTIRNLVSDRSTIDGTEPSGSGAP